MKNSFVFILIFIPIICFSQDEITFKIEDLKKPNKLLKLTSYQAIFPSLILDEEDPSIKATNFQCNIVAKSKAPDSLVSIGYHSFFYGMYKAYADHRPFVLSPDMIWLIISQGYAQHVNSNSEKLRSLFVNFSGKKDLEVRNDSISLKDTNRYWENTIPEFSKLIEKHVGKELIGILSCNFSTTTSIEKIASEITIMKSMESYFEYYNSVIICGIPEITLKGTTKDWQEILDKAKALKKYDLDWWIKELEPILEEFIKTSKGEIDKNFWKNMFKYHESEECGVPDTINGWIVKFFPYNIDGQQNNLNYLTNASNLPEEIVKVDFTLVEKNLFTTKTTPMELWAGFIGLEQNPETYALTPKIGWMIKKKNEEIAVVSIEEDRIDQAYVVYEENVVVHGRKIPDYVYYYEKIGCLEIQFTGEIIIPDQLKEIKIGKLDLYGKIKKKEINRIIKLFPNTIIMINGNQIYKH